MVAEVRSVVKRFSHRPRSRSALKVAVSYRKSKAYEIIGPWLVADRRLPEWDEGNRKAIDRALVTLGLDYAAERARQEQEGTLTSEAAQLIPQLKVSAEWDSVE